MPDSIFDSALLSMCMTWRHDFGLLDRKEQMELKRLLLPLYEHHVKPAIDRASSAESSLAAMRQRVEEAERQCDGYKKACNDVVGEMLAKDEQDRIGNHIASLLSYTMIVQALPSLMVNAQALQEAVEAWRKSRKNVSHDDISTVQLYRAERDAAIARAEREEEALRDLRGWTGMLAAQAKNIPLDIMEQVVSVCKKADFVLSSLPTDASAMGGERELTDSALQTPWDKMSGVQWSGPGMLVIDRTTGEEVFVPKISERERRLVRLAGILSARKKPISCARCGWIGLEHELKAGVALGWFCPSCGSHEITEDIATIARAALAGMEQKP